MFIAHVTGYLGSDAKKTQKGYSFNVSTKYKEGSEEKTLWICCFLNYDAKVAEYLKSGTLVHVYGDTIVSTFTRDTGEVIPSVSMNVDKVLLLPSKNKNNGVGQE